MIRLIEKGSTSASDSSVDDLPLARWTCSFVNNMPDGAFIATERQFLDLLAAGSGAEVIEVRRLTMSGIARESKIAEYLDENYQPVSTIKETPPDVLVVTGSNPIELQIENEPYWEEMRELLQWGLHNVSSLLLSCLAAHAALVVFDKIARVHLEEKCTGVFRQWVDTAEPLAAKIDHDVVLPHSRTNTANVNDLRKHGYAIVIENPAVGWSLATKKIGACQVVLVQAHPEYEPSSLLREYRRDAQRYVTSQRQERPILPYHCVATTDWEDLELLHGALTPSEQGVQLLDEYPFEKVGARAPWPWRSTAEQLYTNWLSGIRGGKGSTHA